MATTYVLVLYYEIQFEFLRIRPDCRSYATNSRRRPFSFVRLAIYCAALAVCHRIQTWNNSDPSPSIINSADSDDDNNNSHSPSRRYLAVIFYVVTIFIAAFDFP